MRTPTRVDVRGTRQRHRRITPERAIREGDPIEQLLDVIEHDVDIAMLVLAASPERKARPLVTRCNTVGFVPVPVIIVTGRPQRQRKLTPCHSALQP